MTFTTCHKGFNSKLVRLKVFDFDFLKDLAEMFQFQTGSIKRVVEGENYDWRILGFNSKLVRLKVKRQIGKSVRLNSFNSKLVRLKEADN